MDNFLPFIKKKHISHIKNTSKVQQEKLFFQIGIDSNKQAFVDTINEKGVSITPDYHLYSGETFHVLRSIDAIREKQQEVFSWEKTHNGILLKDYPYLIHQLLRCKNLKDGNLKELSTSNVQAEPLLMLDKQGNEIVASFALKVGNESIKDFFLLTDSFVMAENTIYPIRTIGENYERLDLFRSSFPEYMLEKYLSVFYSYTENIIPVYGDYTLEYADNEMPTVPTLVFEKVDTDMSLYLRATQMLPHADADFFQQFDLVYIANLTSEHKIQLKRIAQLSNENILVSLHKLILQHAPDKASAKEVYREDDFFIIPQKVAGPFLLKALPTLVKEYQILGAEKLYEYKVKPIIPKLSLNIGSGIDFLEGEASIENSLQVFKSYQLEGLDLSNKATGEFVHLGNLTEQLGIPLLKGFFFLMGGLGMLELAYEYPPYVTSSVFNTLQYVRLTELGKYALGLTSTYTSPLMEKKKLFHLDGDRLLIRSLEPGNPYESMLQDTAIPIGGHRFVMNSDSFLKNCKTEKDVTDKMDFFKQFISQGDIPEIWTDFFTSLLRQCHPLKKLSRGKYVIYQLDGNNKELIRLLTTDSVLKSIIIRAEGYMILVDVNDQQKLIDRLKTYGYLL